MVTVQFDIDASQGFFDNCTSMVTNESLEDLVQCDQPAVRWWIIHGKFVYARCARCNPPSYLGNWTCIEVSHEELIILLVQEA